MMRCNWSNVQGKTSLPLSYALTGFFVVIPILSFDFFYYYHLFVEYNNLKDNPNLLIDTFDGFLYVAMGIGANINLYHFFDMVKENILILLVNTSCQQNLIYCLNYHIGSEEKSYFKIPPFNLFDEITIRSINCLRKIFTYNW